MTCNALYIQIVTEFHIVSDKKMLIIDCELTRTII